jgi:hypothetical protein
LVYVRYVSREYEKNVTVTVRVLGALAVLSLFLLAFLAFVGKAAALEGDPPIAASSPADGASVPAVEEGLKVAYSCPSYRTGIEVEIEEIELPPEIIEVENEEGEIEFVEGEPEFEVIEKATPVFADHESYGVIFSNEAALGPNGRLKSAGLGEAGEAEAELVKGTSNCTSELELPTAPNPAVLYSGRVYWQAYRECEECLTGFETGPVQSFVVVPTIEEAEINFENHPYGGYMTKVNFFASSGLKGAKVALQQWTGSEWLTIAEEPGTELGENNFYVTLGAGHKLLRPVAIGTNVTLPLEEKSKTIRRAKKGGTRTPVPTGKWAYSLKSERESFPLTFKVTDGGTMLRGLNASVEAICKGPAKGQKTTIEATSTVKSVPIAPDGSVVAHFATTGATPTTVTLIGNFFDGRFNGQLTSEFLGNCLGFRQFEAVPEGGKG